MYENRNQPNARDGSGRHRSRSPPPARHHDGWDRDYYRSRKDPHSPSNEDYREHRHDYQGDANTRTQTGSWNGSRLPGTASDGASLNRLDHNAQSYTRGAAFPVQTSNALSETADYGHDRPPVGIAPEENFTTYDPFPVPSRYYRGPPYASAAPIADTTDDGNGPHGWSGPANGHNTARDRNPQAYGAWSAPDQEGDFRDEPRNPAPGAGSRYDDGPRREDHYAHRDQGHRAERYDDSDSRGAGIRDSHPDGEGSRRDRDERSSRSYDEDDRDRAYRGPRNDAPSRFRDDREEEPRDARQRRENASGGRRGLSRTIQIGTLPDDASERDILYGLDRADRDPNLSSDQIKVVRIREDRRGRRVAFAEFYRSSDAEGFMQRHGSSVSFPLEHSRGSDSKPLHFTIDFAERDDRDDMETRDIGNDDFYDDGWKCPNCDGVNYPGRYACYRCRTERPDNGYERDYDDKYGPVLTGETDECPQQTPSHFVVIRDLHSSVTEEVLAKGVSKLFVEKPAQSKDASSTPGKLKSTAPTNSASNLGAKPDSLRRIFLMRDRRTDESWRYGFAEFATIEDARAAVAKFSALPKFTISSRPVMVAFIHSGVFIPAADEKPRHDDDREFSFAPITNPSIRLRYWDERGYPSVLIVSEPSKSSAPSLKDSHSIGTPDGANKVGGVRSFSVKKPKKEKETGAKAIAMAPQMQMWAKKAAELHGFKKQPAPEEKPAAEKTRSVRVLDQDQAMTGVDSEPSVPRLTLWNDQYTSYADWDKLACLVCNVEAPADDVLISKDIAYYTREQWLIDHEVKVHNHFKDADMRMAAAEKLAALSKEPRTIIRRVPRPQTKPAPKYKSYADREALICHLCARRFKHFNTLLLHEQESELHKRMLKNPRNTERAIDELKAKGMEPVVMKPSQKEQSQYRDRARERRVAFNQPTKPSNKSLSKPSTEKRKETVPATATPEDPVKKSKGAGMLAKMGWTAGAGLGAEGAGRTEAVATDAYAPGVGLGAEGGKLGDASEEAARNTRGNFSDFVEKTREKARERYDRL